MASRVCRKGGQCSAVGGRCAATHPAQCVWSERCALEKRCVLDAAAGRCDDGMRRNDPDLAIGGAALMGVGAASLMAGVVVGIMGTGSQISSGLSGRSASSSEVAVAALMIGGVVTAGLGVPLLLVGLRRVPREAPGAPPARRSAALRIDLGAATLRGEF